MGSRDKVHDFLQFDVPSFSLEVSQEEKEAQPEGVFIVDSQPHSLEAAVQVINCDVEDIVTKYMTTSAQCTSIPSLPGTSSCSLPDKFIVVF